MKEPIFILGALREEISQIRKLMVVKEQLKAGHADVWLGVWEGVHIVLVRTGMGKECALDSLKKVLSSALPAIVLSIGYAGALDLKLKVGDLVIADKVLELDQATSFAKSFPVNPEQQDLFKMLTSQEQLVVYKGTLLTVNQVISDSSAKQKLGSSHKALAVDMETSSLIAHCIEKKIPLISVRAISDTMEQSLINTNSFIDNEGRVSKIRAGWYVVTHPNSIKSFISLRSQSQKATSNLTEIIGLFLRNLGLKS
jgi:adenosylhomocysteine nucleosidase